MQTSTQTAPANASVTASEPVCCPEFNPKLWDNKTFNWEDKLFIRDSVPQFLHIPLPGKVNQVITRLWDLASKAGAQIEGPDFIVMAYDPGPWKSEFYMSVTKEVPGATNVSLSGEFFAKVFDGPYNAVPQWIKVMDETVKKQERSVKKYFFYYVYCPKCAKKFGHNYVVALAELV